MRNDRASDHPNPAERRRRGGDRGAAARRAAAAARIHSAAIHLLRRLRRQDAATGLSPARLSALSVLVFGGPRALGRLAAAEQVSAPTMTRLVDALEKEGLAVRKPDPEDRRAVRVVATERGEAVLREGQARRLEHLGRLLDGVADDDLATLEKAAGLLEEILREGAGD